MCAVPVIVFFGLAVTVAIVVHWRWRRYVWASLLSGAITALLYQGAGFCVIGYIDPFFIIALPILYIMSASVAFAIGAVAILLRDKN